MKLKEVTESQNLNAYTKLVKLLGSVFGFERGQNPQFKRVKQAFDQQTGEHVLYFEYRVRARNQSPIPAPSKQDSKQQHENRTEHRQSEK